MSMRYPGGLIATSPVNARYPSGVWTQAQAAPYQAQNVWTRDQFWPYTTLLLQGDGAVNGAQNNTFLDSSSNNFTITRNGNTTQGSFTPYEQDGYWSNFLNGGYLSLTNSTGLGSNNFTVEFWGLDISGSSNWGLFSIGGTSGSDFAGVTMASNGGIYISTSGSSWQYSNIGGLTFSTDGQWHHYAIVRNGGSLLTFKDGVLIATTSITGTIVNNSGQWRVGAKSDQAGTTTGYLSNFRVVNGTALYTSAFTPSAAPLTAITNTSLLTCQSNRFKDNSTNNFTLTVNGNTSVQAFQPFPGATTWSASVLGGSGYFDGSGDYLSATMTGQTPGTGSFTYECWFYLGSLAAARGIMNTRSGDTTDGFDVTIQTSGNVYLSYTNTVLLDAAAGVKPQTWYHLAIVRNGSTNWVVYLNGASIGTISNSSNFTSTTLFVGAVALGGSSCLGYIADFRYARTAVYTAAFTPPTAPLTAIANTAFLASCTNAGIFDAAVMNDLETVGNAQVSTSVVKYGTGSMYFDGSGDWLKANTGRIADFGTGDFTVEAWVYLLAHDGNQSTVFAGGINQTTYNQTNVNIDTNGTVNLSGNQPTSIAMSLNTWTHIAVSRAGGISRIFINGVLGSSATNTTNYNGIGCFVGVRIGDTGDFGDINGYIDDLRVTKGAARYITNFTPPPARLPAQ